MNNELINAAKDQAAREIYQTDFKTAIIDIIGDYYNGIVELTDRAMEIYAEGVAVEFADWIAQNCRMYENEFSLYNLNEDVLEIRPVSELYELFNLFKTTKP